MRIRDARPGDVAELVELLRGGALTIVEDGDDLAPYAEALDRILASPDDTVLVADDDGRVVGMCQVMVLQHLQHRGGRCAEIESVHVAADQRGRGVGGVLVEAAVARAHAAGCYRVQLTSNVVRSDAHRFYAAHGFTASHVGFKRLLD